jgi:hypothetical protein
MPVLKRFPDCRIAIYPRDHRPAHVHVEFRDGGRVTVEIETLLAKGAVRPAAKMSRPMRWIEANRVSLLARWKEIVK